ncbi:FAD binding domain protein [Hypoxylon sp. FL1284]|nr:FAD binding domain protein [Hypoxylon sp. FL1284]
MSPKNGFKIIIIGGGIAGLTLANMLEVFDIDYVLLESHDEIIPPVGASLGLAANGLLVLDQLGIYDALFNVARDTSFDNLSIMDQNNITLTKETDVIGHFENRFGYAQWFFSRTWFLEALYEKLRRKDKILLGKRVAGIVHGQDDVKVTTKDGQVYTGAAVVGCDGIYSVVRAEMARIANESRPGTFDEKEEESIPCYYQCSFGTAQGIEQWGKRDISFTMGDGSSFLVGCGPEGQVFWFFTVKLPEVKYGRDIPRYTKEDDERFLKKYAHLKIKKDLTFGQLVAKRITSTLTPLHEVVMKKWFYKRIVLIGDSCHKQNPLGGQGGNSAIETAAEFVNGLLDLRDSRRQGLEGVTSDDIEAVSRKMQSIRYSRVKRIVQRSHDRQALFAKENPVVSHVVMRWLAPIMWPRVSLDEGVGYFGPASRLNRLPVPFRPHLAPYDADLPAKPIRSAAAKMPRWIMVASMAYLLYISTKALRLASDELGDWGGVAPLDRNWLGDTSYNDLLKMLVSAFSYQILDGGPTATLHVTYFLTQLAAPMLVWVVEGYRLGNAGRLISLPTIFLVAMQLHGIGAVGPVYGILSALSAGEFSAGRWIPVHVAKALIPALTLGYVVPCVMMMTPTANTRNAQDWVAVWQFSPLLFPVFTALFASVIKQWKRLTSSGVKESPFDFYKDEDVPVLKTAYYFTSTVMAAAHVCTLAYAYFHPDITISNLFFELPNPFESEWAISTTSIKIAVFLKYDFVISFLAIAGYGLYAIWTLRKRGYVTTLGAAAPALLYLLGQVVVGPGTALIALWSWRESALADLSTVNKPPPEEPKAGIKITTLPSSWRPRAKNF